VAKLVLVKNVIDWFAGVQDLLCSQEEARGFGTKTAGGGA